MVKTDSSDHSRLLVPLASFCVVLFGMSVSITGPTLLDIQKLVNTDIQHITIIYTARSIGYLIGSLSGGIIFDMLTRKQIVLTVFNFFSALTIFAIPWSRSMGALYALMIANGLSLGVLDTVWFLFSNKTPLVFQPACAAHRKEENGVLGIPFAFPLVHGNEPTSVNNSPRCPRKDIAVGLVLQKRGYPLNPRPDAVALYSGCTPGRIIGKLEEGRSVTSVAAEFGIAHSIVSRLWRQFQTTGTAIRGFSSARPRGTTPADDRYIVLQARRNRRQTAGEIARHTTQATGRPISRFTVARRLHGGGLFARRPVRCVPLTPAHRRRRSRGAGNTGIGETMNGDEYSLQMRADSV
ncbi:HTH_Tnp_Tc3_2 domain-containing protein [Trichonephila clavipes]|nr:HTH_Tnp_Tc3_2 domain-containing protein [Trichonephila clavipes]